MGKPTLELKIGKHKALPDACGHTTVVKGVGKSKPDFTNLGDRIAKRVTKNKKNAAKKRKKGAQEVTPATPSFLPPSFKFRSLPTLIPAVPATDGDFDKLVNGADALQKFMVERQFEQFVDMILKDRESVMRDGLAFVPDDTKKGVQTQIDALAELRKELHDSAADRSEEDSRGEPGHVCQRHPQPAAQRHHARAVRLPGCLRRLPVGTAAVARSGLPGQADGDQLPDARTVPALHDGSLDSQKDGTTTAPFIPTQSFKVGMAILTAFAGMGLGTIPGWGPLGLHLLMVPKDMFDFAGAPSGPLFFHESIHQVIADTDLLKELQMVVVNALNAAFQKGSLPLTTQTVQIGRFKKPTIEVLGKTYTDWINEIIADVGAVLNGGPVLRESDAAKLPGSRYPR